MPSEFLTLMKTGFYVAKTMGSNPVSARMTTACRKRSRTLSEPYISRSMGY
jgi:hypothetical protein